MGTLVHTADIQNVQAAFLKMKEQGLCNTQPYRLLARGGGFSWVQTRASCAPARRGSGRGQSISCQHFQITGVQEREVIMASIQMPSEAEKERAEEVVELEKTNHLLIFDQPTPKLPTSLPTSVIVTSRPPGPKPVTQSLSRKKRKDRQLLLPSSLFPAKQIQTRSRRSQSQLPRKILRIHLRAVMRAKNTLRRSASSLRCFSTLTQATWSSSPPTMEWTALI